MKRLEEIMNGQLRDSTSPIQLVQKLDKQHMAIEGSYRVTADTTTVNQCFQHLPCHLPWAPKTAASISSFQWKILIDIKDAFYHCKLPPQFLRHFGVSTPLGIIRFLRCIQGFLNSPTIMQDTITALVDFPLQRELIIKNINAIVLSFVDNVAGGGNEAEPFEMLARLLKRCIAASLTVLPESIQCGREITLLGKFLNQCCQITIAERHLQAIDSIQPPTNATDVRKTVAFCNYLRDFVPRFAEATTAMRAVMNEQRPMPRDVDLEFQRLKNLLIRHLLLKAFLLDSHLVRRF